MERRLGEHAERARDAATLREFMQDTIATLIGDRGFCECAGTRVFAEPHVRDLLDEAAARQAELLERAQAAGEVRGDVTPEDVAVLLMALTSAGAMIEPTVAGSWRRQLDIVLDGLRPEAARPLSRKSLTRRQLAAARCSR